MMHRPQHPLYTLKSEGMLTNQKQREGRCMKIGLFKTSIAFCISSIRQRFMNCPRVTGTFLPCAELSNYSMSPRRGHMYTTWYINLFDSLSEPHQMQQQYLPRYSAPASFPRSAPLMLPPESTEPDLALPCPLPHDLKNREVKYWKSLLYKFQIPKIIVSTKINLAGEIICRMIMWGKLFIYIYSCFF